MAQELHHHVCDTKDQADHAKGLMTGNGFSIIFGPEQVDVGVLDCEKDDCTTQYYAGKWVVIGRKP